MAVSPTRSDTIVTLGDYIDRGPDSRGVIDQLLDLDRRCRLIALRGNHEQMLLDAHADPSAMGIWSLNGGDATLDSYGVATRDDIPAEHLDFIRRTTLVFETAEHFCVHASYDANRPLTEQDREVLLWRHLDELVPEPHISGKIGFVGHTPMLDDVFDLGHLVCLDTGCGKGGRLTALDLVSRQLWQVSEAGECLHEVASG